MKGIAEELRQGLNSIPPVGGAKPFLELVQTPADARRALRSPKLGPSNAIRDGIRVARDRLAPHEESLKGGRSAPCKGIQYRLSRLRQPLYPVLRE